MFFSGKERSAREQLVEKSSVVVSLDAPVALPVKSRGRPSTRTHPAYTRIRGVRQAASEISFVKELPNCVVVLPFWLFCALLI